MTSDPERIEIIADELRRLRPIELVLRAESLLHLVGLVQLALRHPAIAEEEHQGGRVVAREFVDATLQYFAESPMALELVKQGDNEAYDAVPAGRRRV